MRKRRHGSNSSNSRRGDNGYIAVQLQRDPRGVFPLLQPAQKANNEVESLSDQGLPQGSSLLPSFFLLYNADLVKYRISNDGEVIAIVDDCMMWVVEGCKTTPPLDFNHTCAKACNCIKSVPTETTTRPRRLLAH